MSSGRALGSACPVVCRARGGHVPLAGVAGGACSSVSCSPRPRAARASPVCRAKATVVMKTGRISARGLRSSPRARAESRTSLYAPAMNGMLRSMIAIVRANRSGSAPKRRNGLAREATPSSSRCTGVVAVRIDAATMQTSTLSTIRAAVGPPSCHHWNRPMAARTGSTGRTARNSRGKPAPLSRNRAHISTRTAGRYGPVHNQERRHAAAEDQQELQPQRRAVQQGVPRHVVGEQESVAAHSCSWRGFSSPPPGAAGTAAQSSR